MAFNVRFPDGRDFELVIPRRVTPTITPTGVRGPDGQDAAMWFEKANGAGSLPFANVRNTSGVDFSSVFAANVDIPIGGNHSSNSYAPPGPASPQSSITFNSNGSGDTTAFPQGASGGFKWHQASPSTNGSAWEILFSGRSGSGTWNGSFDVWQNLGAGRGVSLTNPGGGTVAATCNYTIRRAGSGANQVSGVLSLSAEKGI